MKLDELIAKLSEDEALKTSFAKDPLTILKLVTVEPAPCSDPKIQMTIITFLGIFVCLVLCSAIGYFIACLLYTSPSPRDRTRSRMPSSA